MSFLDWDVQVDDLEFVFPERNSGKISFSEWLWRETLTKIKGLPEISYDEIPELLE